MNTSDNISLELLAHVAARLLRGNNHLDATRRAYQLLETCAAHLLVKADERAEQQRELLKQFEAAQKRHERKIPWKKAVKKITGERGENKATAAFKAFFRRKVRTAEAKIHIIPDENNVKHIIATMLTSWKEEGIRTARVKEFRKEYEAQSEFVQRKARAEKRRRRLHTPPPPLISDTPRTRASRNTAKRNGASI